MSYSKVLLHKIHNLCKGQKNTFTMEKPQVVTVNEKMKVNSTVIV